MAYNNGFPVGYQAPYQQAYYPMNNYQTQQQNGLIWVQGEAAAKSYPVAPNNSVALWDSEANVVYIKTVDASGMPSMKIADYKMRDNASTKTKTADSTEFATKNDILHIQDEIDSLKAKIEGEKDAK